MLKLFEFLLCITVALSACGPETTKTNEGRKLCCYLDTKKIPTIGIGFNLQRADATTVLSKYNLKLENVLKDCQNKTNKTCLTNNQADDIFNRISYPEAAACVDRYVANLPTNKRSAIIDVAFAGCATLNKFVQMKGALEKKDWQQAGNELKSSAWCTQVKQTRCNADYNCIIDNTCTGGVCGSFVRGCLSNSNCYCFKMSNGTGFCSQDFYCSQYGDCTSCPSATSVCLTDTCCGQPRCIPLSLATACKSSSSSTNRLLDLIQQTNAKQSNEKTATQS